MATKKSKRSRQIESSMVSARKGIGRRLSQLLSGTINVGDDAGLATKVREARAAVLEAIDGCAIEQVALLHSLQSCNTERELWDEADGGVTDLLDETGLAFREKLFFYGLVLQMAWFSSETHDHRRDDGDPGAGLFKVRS